MAIQSYHHEGNDYFEVIVSRRDRNGKRIRKKTKYDKGGKRISSRASAQKIEYRLRKKVEEISTNANAASWENWHNECIRRMKMTLRRGTICSYEGCFKKWLSPQWRSKPINKISKEDVFDLVFNYMESKDGFTKKIQKNTLIKINRLFDMAIEDDIIAKNPARNISIKVAPPEKKVLNTNQANLLLEAAKCYNHRFFYHWAIALFTGMRNGELYALRWSDIDLDTGLISVSKQWTPQDGLHRSKSNKSRVIPISDELKKLLIELKKNNAFTEKFYAGRSNVENEFVNDLILDDLVLPRLTEWRNGEQSRHLKAFCEKIGISPIKFHDLRATTITNMLSHGVPLVKVMSIVGHSKMSTTDQYLRLAGVDIKKEETTNKLGYRLFNEHQSNVVNFS